MFVDQSNTSSDPLVFTGSHNWSNSADGENDENTLIIHDATIANVYYQEFVERFSLGVLIDGILENIAAFSNVKSYPNPTSDYINVEFKSVMSENISVKLFSLAGQLMIDEKLMISTGMNTFRVNLESIPKGTYILNLQGGDVFYSDKIIVY